MAPRIFIFSIVLGAKYLSYVKSIATFALTFLRYIISQCGAKGVIKMKIRGDVVNGHGPILKIIISNVLHQQSKISLAPSTLTFSFSIHGALPS